MGWQEKVAKEFNRSFNEPFMPDGFCKAFVKEERLFINLSNRDVEFDIDGNCVGSGSCVGEAGEWEVHRV